MTISVVEYPVRGQWSIMRLDAYTKELVPLSHFHTGLTKANAESIVSRDFATLAQR